MDSMLGRITDFCSNFAVAISDVVNTDVIIIDSKMNIVGSAFRHFSLYNDIKIGSLVADVIVNNHNVIIEDKAKVKMINGKTNQNKSRQEKKSRIKPAMEGPIIGEKLNANPTIHITRP